MAAVAGLEFLTDLALVTVVAAGTTLLFYRLRQPVIVGYLLAGILLGPYTPGATVRSVESVRAVAELGVVFLMFAIGLEFRLSRLLRAGVPAVGAALVQIALVVVLTLGVGGLFGWSANDALFVGAILAISSTVIAAKVISERRQQGEPWAELALAILIVEDVVAVALLAVLGSGRGEVGLADIAGVLGRIATFAVAALVLGLLFVPRLVNFLVQREAHEVLVVCLAGLALGTALLALELGFSPALGAFLIGAVVAEASEAWRAEERVLPLRDLFSAVFFVSIGMLLDPRLLVAYWQPIAVLAVLLVAFRVALYSLPAMLLGAAPRTAFRASMALGHIGEFSFVIAGLGVALGAVSEFVLPVTVAIAILSAFWTPYLVASSDRAYDVVAGLAPAGLREAWRRRAAQRRVQRAARAERLAPERRRLLGRAALNAAGAAIILYATGAVAEAVATFVTVQGLSDRAIALLPWIGGGVLALPFSFNAVRLAWVAAAPGPRLAPEETAGPRTLRTPWLLAVTAAAVVLLALLLVVPFLPPLPLLMLSIAAFLGAALALSGAIARLHARVEKALEDALGGEAQGEARLAALDAVLGEVRWGLDVGRHRVRPGTRPAGATVQALDLRNRTGATLVAVRRGGHTLVNPPPSAMLEPGDQLVLLGEPGQLERARAYLDERPAEAPVAGARVAEVRVTPGSAIEGRALGESGLREAGVTVLAILRGAQRLTSPGRAVRLEAGDVLLVVGTDEGVRAAAQRAGAPGGLSAAGAPSPPRTPGP